MGFDAEDVTSFDDPDFLVALGCLCAAANPRERAANTQRTAAGLRRAKWATPTP
jgi:hypothetical protein